MKKQDHDHLSEIMQERRICKLGERQRTAVRYLDHATSDAQKLTREIMPTVGDIGAHPLPAVQDLTVCDEPRRTLAEAADEIAAYLADETRLAVPGHGRGLDEFLTCFDVFRDAACELIEKKTETGAALGNAHAVDGFRAALAALPSLTSADVEPFRVAFRRALMTDAEGTAKANECERDEHAERLDAIQKEISDTRQDFANLGDEIFDAVGRERIPPEWKEIDPHSRRELYELVKVIKGKRTGKRGALDKFMDAATWSFRGFTVREIFVDTHSLDQFYNAERMRINREPDNT